jgi:ribonuclease PH
MTANKSIGIDGSSWVDDCSDIDDIELILARTRGKSEVNFIFARSDKEVNSVSLDGYFTKKQLEALLTLFK